MKPRVRIDGVEVPDATTEMIRKAVARGSLVVAIDDANIAIQIDKAMIARIDRRKKYYPCTNTSKNPPASPN